MMAHFRHSVRLSERQLAILALVHGIALGTASKGLRADACTPEVMKRLS
jgi:hypothetical protein